MTELKTKTNVNNAAVKLLICISICQEWPETLLEVALLLFWTS